MIIKELIMLLNKIPNLTYPAGAKDYNIILDQEGNLSPRIILWDSAWNYLIGFGIAGLLSPISIYLSGYIVPGLVLGLAAYKKVIINDNSYIKSFIDIGAHVMGAITVSLLVKLYT